MVKKLHIALLILFLIPLFVSAQKGQKYSYKKKFGTQKNAAYIQWGYNRSLYSLSDINFYGPDYNFTLTGAAAHDRPATKFLTYVNPKTFTVPQFSIRVGWYYKWRWDISIGYDHMKYVMDDWQSLVINGVISDPGNPLYGVYTTEDGVQPINRWKLHYENTDGLNYISFQLNNTAPFFKTKNRKFAIQRRLGGGAGPVICQTDFTWDYQDNETRAHVGGFGLSTSAGLRFDFFNRFYFQSTWRAGWINLIKNNTIQAASHYAKHNFFFVEWDMGMGILFYFRTVNGCDTCPDWH